MERQVNPSNGTLSSSHYSKTTENRTEQHTKSQTAQKPHRIRLKNGIKSHKFANEIIKNKTMKRLLTIICAVLITLYSWAEEVNIKLILVTERIEEDRSTPIILSASHEGNIISIYSDVPLNGSQITVKDKIGRILSSEIVPIFSHQPYIFSIGDVENGIYILEVYDGKQEYRGYFEIYH